MIDDFAKVVFCFLLRGHFYSDKKIDGFENINLLIFKGVKELKNE